MTVTHTIGVFALGLVTLLLSQFIVPETLYPWLTLASGLLVVAVGASVLVGAAARRRGPPPRHDHHHGHSHDHHHGHSHAIDRRGLLGVGVAAGLLPCPSALVVLLSAIALHRVGFGLALIVAFSLGLAATITSIGLVAVLAKRAFSRVSLERPRRPPAARRERARDPRGRRRRSPSRRSDHGGSDLAMFGLDDHIAALSNGGSVLIVLLVATLLGLRHATDPDHIAAVTTLVASGRERARRRAAALGAWWGLGHALTLVVFGRPDPALRGVPARARAAGRGDGGRGADRLPRASACSSAGARLLHLHAHAHGTSTPPPVRTPLGAFGIGLVHGMGGSAGVGVLLLAAIPSTRGRRARRSSCSRSSPRSR